MHEKPYSQSKSSTSLRPPAVDQLAGKSAGGGEHVVARLLVAVDGADHLGVGRQAAAHRPRSGAAMPSMYAWYSAVASFAALRPVVVGAASRGADRRVRAGLRGRRRPAAASGACTASKRAALSPISWQSPANTVHDPVVKSCRRVPTASTTSASPASSLALRTR